MVTAGAAAMGWTALALFRRGGVRETVRLVSAAGFAVSLLAIAQAATAGRAIYWRFTTEHEGPLPFGPFVNRNHFATGDHGPAGVPRIHRGPCRAAPMGPASEHQARMVRRSIRARRG
jgi:hypothetical protein